MSRPQSLRSAGAAPANERPAGRRRAGSRKHPAEDAIDALETVAVEPAATGAAGEERATASGAAEDGGTDPTPEDDPDELFAVRRRRRNEPPRCRVPECKNDLSMAFHARHRICPRHYQAPSIHVAGRQWRFCQQCAKFHALEAFVGDKRSCDKSLSSHNKRRRGMPRSRAGSAGADSSGGSTSRVARPSAAGAGAAGSGSSDSASPPMATPAAAAPVAPAEGSSGPPPHGSNSQGTPHEQPAGAGQLQHSAPSALVVPLQPELAPAGLPWPAPAEPPCPVHQGRVHLSLAARRSENEGQFSSTLLGLLLSDTPQQPAGAGSQAHAHAALLDAYDSLLHGAGGAPTVPSTYDLLEIADELGIFADHLSDPMVVSPDGPPQVPPAAPPAAPPPSTQLNAAGAAYQTSSSGAAASSSGNAATLPRLPGAPADARMAVAAAAQAAAAAGMPPMPAWQQQQQAAAAAALRPHGGKQAGSPPLMGGTSASTSPFQSPFQLERLSLKVFGCPPDQLAPDIRSELHSMMGVHPQHLDGYVRSGCTFLTVDLRLDRQRAATLLDASGASGSGTGSASARQARHSNKQDGAGAARPDDAGGTAEAGAASSAGRAAMLQRLACQLLQRRSLGDEGSASPILLQLNAQHLAVVAGSRLLHCMPLPVRVPVHAAPVPAPAPAIPHLSAVSPSVLALPPLAPSSNSCEPAVLALTGHSLWDRSGAPGLVLCRQHGRHLPVEVWGSAPGSGTAAGALIVAVLGLRPGVCELEVQRGSVLGSSRPLLVLPAGMEAAAAELRTPQGGGASGAFLRDVGAVVAWVAHHEQAPPHPPHAPFCTEDVLGSGWSSDEEEEDEEEEEEEEAAPGHSNSQVPLLPTASVAHVAQHAAAHSLRCGWQATGAVLESAATAAQAAAGAEAGAAAAAPAAPAPGWLPGSTRRQREPALDYQFWAPLWRQQLQREVGEPLPPTGPDAEPSWWQAAAGGASSPGRWQLPVEDIKTACSSHDTGRSARVLSGRAMAAVLLALVTAAGVTLFFRTSNQV